MPLFCDSCSSQHDGFVFECLSSEEAQVFQEIEMHVCACLRHLSQSLENDLDPSTTGVSKGSLCFQGMRPLCLDDDSDPDNDIVSDTQSSIKSESCNNPFPPEFTACFEQLCTLTWTVFLRAQLVHALLGGDLTAAAAWAVRFVGAPEPWGLRETQELALQVLEAASTFECKRAVPSSSRTSLFLQETVLNYLDAPIIPRYRRRLSSCLSCFLDQGFFRPSETYIELSATDRFQSKQSSGLNSEAGSQCGLPPSQVSTRSGTEDGCASEPGQLCFTQKAFSCGIDILIARLGNQDLPQSLEDVSKELSSLKRNDSLFSGWRVSCIALATGHVAACHLNPRKCLLAEAQGVIANSGTSWKLETARSLVNAIASTPQDNVKKRPARSNAARGASPENRFVDIHSELCAEICSPVQECRERLIPSDSKFGPRCDFWCGSRRKG